jgi:hypothetical protein
VPLQLLEHGDDEHRRAVQQGTLAGGTWRLGVSPNGADKGYAQQLAAELNGSG